MESLSGSLKHVSIAVSLDSSGFTQAAFSKYIYSLQVLATFLNNVLSSFGFEKMVENKKEVLQALSMIVECSNRMSVILKDYGKATQISSHQFLNSVAEDMKPCFPNVTAFEKVQKENARLFKMYQARLEKARDNLTKTNLTLEFQRRIAENADLARKNNDLTLKRLQRERVLVMEKEIRRLCQGTEHLNDKQPGKHQLYSRVLEYVKGEMWPCSWKLNVHHLSVYEMAEKVFKKVVGCPDHPLTHWLILTHSNIKRKIDEAITECSDFASFLPELNPETLQLKFYYFQEHCDCFLLKYTETESAIAVPASKMQCLEELAENISSEIKNAVLDALEIFHLVYKSLLPDDSETVCYHIIEKHFLKHLWPDLTLLFRSKNIALESKLAESMLIHQSCESCKFSVSMAQEFQNDLSNMLISFLQHQSLVQKVDFLVTMSKKLCEVSADGASSETKLGADEMVPLLSYVILHSKLPQLISHCILLEHLYDMRYMLGEEGYALSSFLAALKCVEMMKLTTCDS